MVETKTNLARIQRIPNHVFSATRQPPVIIRCLAVFTFGAEPMTERDGKRIQIVTKQN